MKWPPGKKTGVLQRARKTNTAREYTRCEHQATRTELLPPGSVHHAKEICTDCDRILRWVPKPKTIARARLNAYRITRLSMCENLTSLERSFVRDVSGKRKFSPRQQAWIDALCARYLQETTP
jgi:hypothetical protein